MSDKNDQKKTKSDPQYNGLGEKYTNFDFFTLSSVQSLMFIGSTLATDRLQYAEKYLFKAISVDERVTESDKVVFILKSIIKTNIFAVKTRTEALWRQVALNTHNKTPTDCESSESKAADY
uniref:Uncharacterized protein n=1 Tax=Glossina palpalis gambiensis TaxID=67801 RepID=A0A1B0B7U9_9MUSC